VDGQDGVAPVVGPGEEQVELEAVYFLFQRLRLGGQFVAQALVVQRGEL